MLTRHPIPALLLFGSIVPLGGALFSQFVLGYPPCPLCMWQRWPYLLPLLAGLLALVFFRGGAVAPPPRPPSLRGRSLGSPRVPSNVLLCVGALGWAITGSIAAYHVGIEHGWWQGEAGCSAGAIGGGDIRAQIMNAPLVACNQVSLRILGLSMANWNFAAAFTLVFMAWKLRRKRVAS